MFTNIPQHDKMWYETQKQIATILNYMKINKGEFLMYEKYIKIINENGGIITTKKAIENGISRTMLKKMSDLNYIEKVERGIYTTDKFIYDEYYIFQLKHPNAIFSYNTAFYFLGLTERTPSKMDVTVNRNLNLSNCKENINLYRINNQILDIGKIEIKTPYGNKVNSYNMERTVCDVINNKTNIDIEIANKAIKNCIKNKEFSASLMFEYAKKMKIYDKVKNYMEAII